MKLAFLGAGKMATAIAGGLIDNKILSPADMIAMDVSREARQAFTARTGIACVEDPVEMMPRADAVFIAVKPQFAEAATKPIASFCARKLIISIAAGLPIAKLATWFGTDRIVRVMPNTPAMVGCGATVFSCGAGVSDHDKAFVTTTFSAVGIVMELPESKQDAVTALSGSGPAYMFETLRSLTLGAAAIGLPPEESLTLAVQTMAGAAEMVKRGMGTLEELRIAVTTPGGTTAAGLKVMADAGFEHLFPAVLKAARDRSIELGKS
ncbi:MAG: pyrroline-5-carboxylate reductase [Lentisphaeria bacterium]|nr:pyrroline-5-carboxylate reductase [Lentisphaeria bacterium]